MTPTVTRRDAIKTGAGFVIGGALTSSAITPEETSGAPSLPAVRDRVFVTGVTGLGDPRSPETIARDGTPDRGAYVAYQEVEVLPDGRWNILLTDADRTQLAYVEGDATTPAAVLLDGLLRPLLGLTSEG
ncbi:MAG: hypothetical protein M3R02_30645 [Chloroflexota bacterium]|nr:hypothetical protein [Chloroflexota bacterium]